MIIKLNDDFDLNKIIYSGQCFRPYETDGHYFFVYKEHILEIYELEKGNYNVSCSKDEWNDIWINYFDLSTTYSTIRDKLSEHDEYLRVCTKEGEGIRILKQDKWEMLISFIISQRKSIPAIRSCIEKICVKYGKKLDCGIYTFPLPSELAKADEEDLKGCGLGYRVPYVIDAARKINDGQLDLDEIDLLDDNALFEKLKEIKGVGDKVANCVELFGYHRIERAPVDTWINKVINEQYGGSNPFSNMKWAGIAQQYIFYYAQNVSRKNT